MKSSSLVHKFFVFIIGVVFLLVSSLAPADTRVANAQTDISYEDMLSDMSVTSDLVGIGATCLLAPYVDVAVSAATLEIQSLIGGASVSPVSATQTTADSTRTTALSTSGTAEGVSVGAAKTAIGASATGVPVGGTVLSSVSTQLASISTQLLAMHTSQESIAVDKKASDQQKKADYTVTDCLVYNAGQQMLNQLTNNIVKWIQGGFNGSPSFSVNTHEIFLSLADMVAGDLAREIRGIAMCDFNVNFKNDLANTVELAAKREYKFDGKTKCPFPETFNLNSSDFYSGVNQVGWMGVEYAMQESGNPFGVAVLAGDELALRSSEKKEVREQELSWSNGFTNLVDTENCTYRTSLIRSIVDDENATTITEADWEQAVLEEKVTSAEVQNYQKTYCKTTTPGKLIGDKLSKATDVDMDRLGMVDNINKIIAATIEQVTKQVAVGIFETVSGEDVELQTNYVTVAEKTAEVIAMENAAIGPCYDAWQAEVTAKSDAETKLASLEEQLAEAQAADTTDSTILADIASLQVEIDEQQAIIDAAGDDTSGKIGAAKSEYDTVTSAESSTIRSENLNTAQAAVDAAKSVLDSARDAVDSASSTYYDYLAGSISSGGDYVAPDANTLSGYKSQLDSANATLSTAESSYQTATDALWVAKNPATCD